MTTLLAALLRGTTGYSAHDVNVRFLAGIHQTWKHVPSKDEIEWIKEYRKRRK
jgi:hypothetical protein